MPVVPLAVKLFIACDDLLALAVRGDELGGMGEEVVESLLVVHQHIPRGGSKEELVPWDQGWVDGTRFGRIVIGPAEVEGVVCPACLLSTLALVEERLEGDRRGLYIRHIHVGGDTASHGSTALVRYVALVSQSRLSKVYLIINATR